MSIHSNYSNYSPCWEADDVIAATLLEAGLYEGTATDTLAQFEKGKTTKFKLYDERLEITYQGSKKQKGELVVKNQHGVEVKRITFRSKKGLTDLFTKYVNGKRDVKKVELWNLLKSPGALKGIMKGPGHHGTSYSYAGKVFPFLTGCGAKALIHATKHARKELKSLQERAMELVSYHNLPRVNFLGATLEVTPTNELSGKIIWKEAGKEPLQLLYVDQEQKRRHVEHLLNSRRLGVEEELREMGSFGKSALKFQEVVVERENKLEFFIDSKTGLIMHNLSNYLKVSSDIPSPDPKIFQEHFGKLIRYFGNQLVTLDDQDLKSLRGVFNQYGLAKQLLVQLKHQYQNLEREKYCFDARVYQQQFPLAFGDMFIDIDRSSAHILISIKGQKEIKRIKYSSEDEISEILNSVIEPLYKKYKLEIETAINKAKNSISSSTNYDEVIHDLKETDEKLRMLYLQNTFGLFN